MKRFKGIFKKLREIFNHDTFFNIFGFDYFGVRAAAENMGFSDRGPTIPSHEDERLFAVKCLKCDTALRIRISKINPSTAHCFYCWKYREKREPGHPCFSSIGLVGNIKFFEYKGNRLTNMCFNIISKIELP